MASLKALRKRITSVKNTQKITRAMKLVSGARLRRASERAEASRPYEIELRSIVGRILLETDWESNLVTKRQVHKLGVIFISTDRGLCGPINSNLFKLAIKEFENFNKEQIEIVALGKKGKSFFGKRGYKIHSTYTDLLKQCDYDRIRSISKKIQTEFLERNFDRIDIFYSQFKSALVQKPSRATLLPFVPEKSESKENPEPFLFEPEGKILLEHLVPMLIDFQVYKAVLENNASEHGARMAAMESATTNATDVISRLTLQRNRARQASITKELMEIIGGAEALKG